MKARILRTTIHSVKRGLRTTRGVLAIVAGLVILAVLPVVIWQLRSPQGQAEAAWFDTRYVYRKVVTVTASSTLTNYATLVTVDTATLISAGKLQSDCDDIRLTDINGKVLPYWIETGTNACNTSTTAIWTKPPRMVSGSNSLYLYYGNTVASGAQDGNQVFDFFDDFSQPVLDGTKWATTGATSVSGGELTITTGSVYTRTNTTNNAEQQMYEIRAKWTGTATSYSGIAISNANNIAGSNANSNQMSMLVSNAATDISQRAYAGDGTAASYNILSNVSQYTPSADTYVYSGFGYKSNQLTYYGPNRTATNSYSTSVQPDTPYVILGYFRGSSSGTTNGTDIIIDFVTVRDDAPTPPTVSVGGSEEITPGPLHTWKFDEAQGSVAYDGVAANNGTITGATWQTPDQCVSGPCLKFDGSGDYVTTAATTTLNNGYTIGMWVRPNSVGITQVFASKYEVVNASMQLIGNNSQIIFRIHQTKDTVYIGRATASGALEVNKWQYITGVWDGSTSSSGIRIYKDGVRIDTTDSQGGSFSAVNSNAITTVIGAQGAGNSVNGFIDEVTVYGYGRSAEQVKVDYNNGAANIGQQDQSTLSQGLLGYWKFNEASWSNNCSTAAILDSSGNGKSGVSCPNATGVTTPAAGKFGGAPDFNGSSQYMQVASPDLPTGDFTYSVWVNLDVVSDESIFGITNGSGVDQMGFDIDSGEFSIRFNGTNIATSTTVLSTGTWYHLAATRKDGVINTYINGVFEDTATDNTTLSFSTCALLIGAEADNTCVNSLGNYTDGRIDELRAYNRALSPDEIKLLYSFAQGPSIWWKFDDNSGTSTTVDSSGGGYSGTLNTMTQANWVPGKKGSALDFDGSTDFVSMADNAVLSPNTITYQTWFKLDVQASTRSENHTLVEHDHGSTPFRAYDLYVDSGNNRLTAGVYNQAGTGVFMQAAPAIAANQWYHAAVTWDGVTARLYLDGTQIASSALSGTSVLNGNGSLTLGDGDGGFGFELDGQLDDFKLYSYARTQSQIMEDMLANDVINEQVTVLPDPVAYWKYDEQYGTTANNSGTAGSTLNGTLSFVTDPIGWRQPVNCKTNGCLAFGGSDYVTTANNSLLDILGPVTLSAWVNPTNLSGIRSIISKAATGATNCGTACPYDSYISTNGSISFIRAGASASYSATTASGVITAGTWYHVTLVDDGISLKIYVNGKLMPVTTSGTYATPTSSNGATRVGLRADSVTAMIGSIDEVKVFNVGLTPGQVSLNYNAASPTNYGVTAPLEATTLTGGAGTGPVAYWKMDENTGTTANDSSGNSLNGTLTGNPTWAPGKLGAGVNFDGVSDYVSVADNSLLEPTNDISIDFWVYQRSLASVEAKDIVYVRKAHSVSPFQSYQIYQQTAGNNVCFLWNNTTPTGYTVCTVHSLSINTWNHIHAVKSGSTLKIYLNGVDESSTTVTPTGTMYNSNGVLSLGDDNGGNKELNGIMDNVRIYGYGRNASQIAYDYNRGLAQYQFLMDECQATTLNPSWRIPNITLGGSIVIGASGSQTAAGTCQTAGTAWGNGVNGKFNSSLNFDGTDDYVNLSTTSAHFQDSTPFSLSTWVKTTDISQTVISKWQNGVSGGWRININASGQATFVLANSDASAGRIVTTNSAVNNGAWRHIVTTYDGSGSAAGIKIYIDGVQATTTTSLNTSPGTLADANLYLAATATSTTPFHYFEGQIDAVGIYSYELSAAQVKTIYNQNGGVRFGPTSGIPVE